MKLSLNEGQLTISMEFAATYEKPITVEEVLIGAYDIISRAFSQEEVIWKTRARVTPRAEEALTPDNFYN